MILRLFLENGDLKFSPESDRKKIMEFLKPFLDVNIMFSGRETDTTLKAYLGADNEVVIIPCAEGVNIYTVEMRKLSTELSGVYYFAGNEANPAMIELTKWIPARTKGATIIGKFTIILENRPEK